MYTGFQGTIYFACRIHIGINKIFASDKVLMRVQTFLFKLIFLVSLHITH